MSPKKVINFALENREWKTDKEECDTNRRET